ncbi:hypothetical protein ACWEPC_28715, partial [Nonomuraea sp. NPDC004297]
MCVVVLGVGRVLVPWALRGRAAVVDRGGFGRGVARPRTIGRWPRGGAGRAGPAVRGLGGRLRPRGDRVVVEKVRRERAVLGDVYTELSHEFYGDNWAAYTM